MFCSFNSIENEVNLDLKSEKIKEMKKRKGKGSSYNPVMKSEVNSQDK